MSAKLNAKQRWQRRHKKYFAEWAAKNYHKRVVNGVCTGCGKAPRPGLRTCQQCYDRSLPSIRKYRRKVVASIYEFYGNRCSCCGESCLKFLTLDHINNDGQADRGRFTSEMNFYIHVATQIKEGNPSIGLRLLCYNCNCGRSRNGGICPHKEIA